MRRFWKHQQEIWPRTKAPCPAVFVEMRLGKTLLAIRRVKTYAPTIRAGLLVLVVGPNSVLDGWRAELEKEDEHPPFSLIGTKKQRKEKLKQACDLCCWDPERSWCLINREGYRSLPQELRSTKWDCVILDESTFLKNPRSKMSKFFCRNFRNAPHRWCLTGMPMPESSLDVVPQMLFLHGEWMGCKNFWEWRNRYCELVGFKWELKTGMVSQFNHALSADTIVLRRQDADMDREKIYATRTLSLSDRLQKTYNTIESEFVLSYRGRTTEGTMQGERLSWMRDTCNGFVDSRYVWDGKVKEILALLQGELAGQSVVIWVDRLHLIPPLRKALSRRKISNQEISGHTFALDRKIFQEGFDSGDIQVLICQAQCAAYGIDLSRADTAIYADSITSGLVRRQSEDRILSLRKDGPLLYIDLVVSGTISEDYYELIQQKRDRSITQLALVKQIQERQS